MTSLKTVSEMQAANILQSQDDIPWCTVVCVRRQLPDWWDLAKRKHHEATFVHAPLRASNEPRFATGLWRFMRGTLPRCASPVLLFCSQGRHRSGMVAALTKRGWLHASIAYLFRAGLQARTRELAVALLLVRRMTEISVGKRKQSDDLFS